MTKIVVRCVFERKMQQSTGRTPWTVTSVQSILCFLRSNHRDLTINGVKIKIKNEKKYSLLSKTDHRVDIILSGYCLVLFSRLSTKISGGKGGLLSQPVFERNAIRPFWPVTVRATRPFYHSSNQTPVQVDQTSGGYVAASTGGKFACRGTHACTHTNTHTLH